MKLEKDNRLQVRVSSQLKKDASSAARRRGMTLAGVINNLLTQFVEAERAQRAKKETESI